MLQINPFLDCTVYSGIVVHIGRNSQYGYESYITIKYENDYYKWTATKQGISYIQVSVEKKEPKIDPLKEFEEKMKNSENEDYDALPF